ncbi:DNA-binding protein [Neomicrococcus aestuarii]|uniref:DNA-binding protein n=1 Tax=Neomicrococcus aestuarii TaxID=556325 RepID=A0A1L2ZL26_9MICC|nr:DNA-binding protein [Neomicrococcus aestuarii]
MVLKDLSDEDRANARAKALEARTRRASIKTEFAAGELSISQILELVPDDEAIARLRVGELLEALPGVGAVRATSIMHKLGISESRRLRGLGRKQKNALTDYFNNSAKSNSRPR